MVFPFLISARSVGRFFFPRVGFLERKKVTKDFSLRFILISFPVVCFLLFLFPVGLSHCFWLRRVVSPSFLSPLVKNL